VNDHAGVLSPAQDQALDARLLQLERDTSSQLVVYVDHRLPPDTTIEELGSQAIRTWGVGQKGKDNGAILFLFIDDHKMRIEVGYGLEPTLTDAKCRSITSQVIKPLLQAGNTAGAIEKGADAIAAVIRGSGFHGNGRTAAPKETAFDGSDFGWIFGIVLVFGGLAGLIAFLVRRGPGMVTRGVGSTTYDSSSSGSFPSSSSSDSFSSSSSSSDSSSSDSSSSDFSGGGGDGGGGGSSDSW
jgi:uncharacterized protein